jgi:HEPN domain-containing protein
LVLADAEPLPEIACYHAQQCAEKYLKGYLVANRVAFKFVHELAYLVRLCASVDPRFSTLLGPAAELQDYATDVRYPSEEFEPLAADEAGEAVSRARRIREFVLANLDSPHR